MKAFVQKALAAHPRAYQVASLLYRSGGLLPRMLRPRSGAWNWFLCGLSAVLRSRRALGRPMTLNIEPTTICDQKCPICETGQGILGRKPGYMGFDQFKAILDQFDHTLQTLFFYFMGESFLNKDAYRMVRYAADKGIYVHSCTNGNVLDPEALVRSGIADIQFQISGTTQEVHETYRVGGRLDKALEHIRQTVAWKKMLVSELKGNPYPMNIGLGFILFKHNEHQIQEFIELARSLEVDEYQVIAPCFRTCEQARDMLPTDKAYWLYDEQALAQGRLEVRNKPDNYCEWLYSSVTIQLDGSVVPCCRDTHGNWVMGNVSKENIYDIWNNAKFRALRGQVGTNQGNFPLCSLCEGFRLLPLKP